MDRRKYDRKKNQIIDILKNKVLLDENYLPARDRIDYSINQHNFPEIAEMILSKFGINPPKPPHRNQD